MTKQPVLTGFPHTVFATAKRRAQAAIQAVRKRLINDSISGYGKARKRIEDSFLDRIDGQIKQVLEKLIEPRDFWRGHTLKAIDGTSVTLMDTLENQVVYPQHRNSKKDCGFPIMGIVGMVNLSHGGVEGFETCDFRKHDGRMAPRLLKYIKLGYENRAGEKAALVVVTDLLDPEKYPAGEVADLYMERWQIEVKFRDLKTTLGMDRFTVKTPEMAHKTLKMMIIAYNLLRSTMQEAAQRAGKKVHEMSVKSTQYSLTSRHETFRGVTGKPLLKKRLYDQLLDTCAEHLLDSRPLPE